MPVEEDSEDKERPPLTALPSLSRSLTVSKSELSKLRKRELLLRANYIKLIILSKAVVILFVAALLSSLFIWRDVGLVDMLSTYANLHRYIVLLLLGRTILLTTFLQMVYNQSTFHDLPPRSSLSLVFFSPRFKTLRIDTTHISYRINKVFMDMQSAKDRSWSNAKVIKNMKVQALAGALSALLMLAVVCNDYFLPKDWTARVISSNNIIPTNATDYDLQTPVSEVVSLSSDGVSKKVIIIGCYLCVDCIASTIATNLFSKRGGLKSLFKQLQHQILTNCMLWFLFLSIVGCASINSNRSFSTTFKVVFLGWIFPFFKVMVVYACKLTAQTFSAAMKADKERTAFMVSAWCAGAEVCLNLASVYAIFLTGSSYLLFLLQFVPQEAIEQLTAFLSHHPVVIARTIELQRRLEKLFNKQSQGGGGVDRNQSKGNQISPGEAAATLHDTIATPLGEKKGTTATKGRGNLLPQETAQDLSPMNERRNSTAVKIDNKLQYVGVEIVARELGEDTSFLAAALLALPFGQDNWCYSTGSPESLKGETFSPPSTADVMVCLFCFSLTIEHVLSVMGIMAVERKGVAVSHTSANITVSNIVAVAFFIVLLAAGEA
jgi:hypothetical protein